MSVSEGRSVRVQGSYLSCGECRQDGPPTCRQVRRQSYPDVGDEGWSRRCTLLDDVENVAPVQNRHVGTVTGPIDQCREGSAGNPLKRLLTGVTASNLEGSDTQPVRPLVGEMDDEPLGDHGIEQVVGGTARQGECTHDAVEGYGMRLARQEAQYPKRPSRRRNLAGRPAARGPALVS